MCSVRNRPGSIWTCFAMQERIAGRERTNSVCYQNQGQGTNKNRVENWSNIQKVVCRFQLRVGRTIYIGKSQCTRLILLLVIPSFLYAMWAASMWANLLISCWPCTQRPFVQITLTSTNHVRCPHTCVPSYLLTLFPSCAVTHTSSLVTPWKFLSLFISIWLSGHVHKQYKVGH